jgi:archaellum component FlaC
MSEEPTKDIPDERSFEERVFARLDSIDARLQSFDSRLEAFETQAERRALETKPIWECALAEILELRRSVENVERKIDVLSRDIVQVRADQSHADARLTRLESESL